MPDFLFFINEILWGSIMIYLLLGAGIWFTLRSGFIQFRYIRKFGRSLKNSLTPQPGGLTSFQALCTSLAARVGSGNLAGVALAISAGGLALYSGCGPRRLSAWRPRSLNARSLNSIKRKTKTVSFAAVRPGIWPVDWGCAGWASCFRSSYSSPMA